MHLSQLLHPMVPPSPAALRRSDTRARRHPDGERPTCATERSATFEPAAPGRPDGTASWCSNPLLSDLSQRQLLDLERFVERRSYAAGATVVARGEPGECFFLICAGSVEVYRAHSGHEHVIATMGAGQYFGIMALMDGQTRTASVRALEPVSLVAVSMARLRTEDPHAADQILCALLANHAREQNRRLRENADTVTGSLERELQKASEQVRLGTMLIVIITMVWGYVVASHQLSTVPELRWMTSLGISLVLGAGAVFLIRKNPYPPSFYGITLHGWRAAVRDALLWALLLIVGILLLKWLLVTAVPGMQGQPVFDIRLRHTSSPASFLLLALVLYVPVCMLQELVARGILHAGLGALLTGRWGPLWALLLSNALFSLFHVHYSVAVALATFALGLYFGLLWIRHRSLLAVALAHYLVGFFAIEVLNVLPLLGMG